MQDALPIVYRLVEINLDACGMDLRNLHPQHPQDLVKLAALHIDWLFEAIQHLACMGSFACTVQLGQSNFTESDGPPFISRSLSIPIRPHGHSNPNQFSTNFAHALREILPEIDFSKSDHNHRRAWIARWLAASALTAHLKLLHSSLPGKVALKPVLGESTLVSQFNLNTLLPDLPLKLIRAMPVYNAAVRDAFQMYMSEIRMGFARLVQESGSQRTKFEMEGRLANLLAYGCSAKGLDGIKKEGSRKLHERARAFLVEHRVFHDEAEAEKQLLALGIGDTFKDRVKSLSKLRFPTKNAEDQARFRGKSIYMEHLACACAQKGILTERLIEGMTQSSRLAQKLMKGLSVVYKSGSYIILNSPSDETNVGPSLGETGVNILNQDAKP